MNAPVVVQLIDMLLFAARNRGVLPYARFHSLFPGSMTLSARHALLEEALHALSEQREFDYSVLLARDNGLPGPDFFRRYRANRRQDYVQLAGDPRYHNPTLKEQRAIAATERARVYEHAARQAALKSSLAVSA